jgi:hypothetical protein
MQVNENNNLEKLVDKMMRETTLDAPSFDFTSKVMSQVLMTKSSDITIYKPLISKGTFALVFGTVLALCVFIFIKGETPSNSFFTSFDYSTLYNKRLFSGFTISKITVYAVVASILMFYIQIPLLKNHIDKRFE